MHEKLWTPNEPLEIPPYEVSPALVREAFAEHLASPNDEVASLEEDSLSAVIVPNKTPSGFLFVDIDDLVGDLSRSLQALQFSEPRHPHERRDNHDYGEDLFFDDKAEVVTKKALIAFIKRSEAGMLPAPDIKTIRGVLLRLRAQGVYTTFVTASTSASELPTIRNFLGRHFRGACDGVVITSGEYTIADKGRAATDVIDFTTQCVGRPAAGTPVVAIDDWPNHTAKIRQAAAALPYGLTVTTLQYRFPSSQTPDAGSEQHHSVLACFERASAIFDIAPVDNGR